MKLPTQPDIAILNRVASFDKVQLWLKTEIPSEILQELRALCRGKVYVSKMKFLRGGWIQRIQLFQPGQEALKLLSRLDEDGVMINSVEIAIDFVTDNKFDAEKLQDFVFTHLHQRWHRDQKYNNYRGTEYGGSHKARNKFVAYSDRPCKITNETHCCHIELRVNEVSAVRAHGIKTVTDLINFNHMSFWRRELRLYWIPLEKLGRAEANRRRKSTKRKSVTVDYGHGIQVSPDSRLGRLLELEAYSDKRGFVPRPVISLQQIVDKHGAIAMKARTPISTDWLLNTL